jgi:ArsR family transcriptional regulator
MGRDETSAVSRTEQPGRDAERPCRADVSEVDDGTVVADVQLLSALGNDTRYELLRRIGTAESDVCVCDLESALGVSQSAISQALSRLYAAGLVSRRKDGRWRYYAVTPRARAILNTLDETRDTPDE